MSKKDTTLAIKLRRLDEIKPLPDNAKLHDLEDIKKSIREFGFANPIGVNVETGHDINGNGRLQALKQIYVENEGKNPPKHIVSKLETNAEMEEVPVWYAPTYDLVYDAVTEKFVALRLNRSQEKGGVDQKAVFAILEEAAAANKLDLTGYDTSIFESLALRYAPPPEFNLPQNGGSAVPFQESSDGVAGQQEHSAQGEFEYATNGAVSVPDGSGVSGHSPSTAPALAAGPAPAPTLVPSYVRMIQLFMNADTQPVFLGWVNQLIQSNQYRREDGNLVDTVTDLVFAVVKDAAARLTTNQSQSDQGSDTEEAGS
jgi:hypothetical protein